MLVAALMFPFLFAFILAGIPIAFSLADGLEVLVGGRAPPERLALIGGGARSAFWAQMIASVLGVTLVRYHASERGPAKVHESGNVCIRAHSRTVR